MSTYLAPLPQRGPAGGFGASSWMITFADLLTLLLCFFLALISRSDLNPANQNREIAQNITPVKPGGAAPAAGTTIATSSNQNEARDHFFALLLTARDFDQAGTGLTERALKKVRKQVVTMSYQSAGATIEFCAQSGSKADLRNRALALHRQLIDAGFSRRGLRLSTKSRPCSEGSGFGQDEKGEEVVTRITLLPRKAGGF